MPALRWTIAAALTLIAVATARSGGAAEGLDYRWLYLQQNLQVAENLPKVEEVLRRAAKTGYNGVVLTDWDSGIRTSLLR